MDTHFLYTESKLSLDKAIEAGNIFGIRNSGEPAQHYHLVAALQRTNAHVLDTVVGKLLGQENGPGIIQEVATLARGNGQSDIARHLHRAVEAKRDEASRPESTMRSPQFTAAAFA